jgi:hypothetical protein
MPIDFSGAGKWRRVYFTVFKGNPENRKIRAPLIEPFELPLLFDKQILAISATCLEAKPRWRTAGYLKQVYSGISFEESEVMWSVNSPTAGVDAASQRIGLNTLELVRFPPLVNQFYLWFDPVHWLPKLTLAIWEFQGVETDNYLEALETVKVDLARIEFKIDASNQN